MIILLKAIYWFYGLLLLYGLFLELLWFKNYQNPNDFFKEIEQLQNLNWTEENRKEEK